jgi:hypothetical protein
MPCFGSHFENGRHLENVENAELLLWWWPITRIDSDIEKFLQVAIFKMAATIQHKFNIVRFQHPELIPDIEKFPQVFGCKWLVLYIKLTT